jgi:hypothetical protein
LSNSSDAPATPRDSPHLSAAELDATTGSFPHISPDPLDHITVGERAPAAGGAVIDELPMGPFDAAIPRKLLTACILPVAPRISSAPILNHVVLTLKS